MTAVAVRNLSLEECGGNTPSAFDSEPSYALLRARHAWPGLDKRLELQAYPSMCKGTPTLKSVLERGKNALIPS